MKYQINRIARDVRVAIDQNKADSPLIVEEDIDTLSLEDIVRSKVEESVRRVVTDAPSHLLDGGVAFGDAVFWRELSHTDHGRKKSRYGGRILLPDDFMRLFVFKMSDWERAVYDVITADDPRYARQSSRYSGIRGNTQKPVVAIVSLQEGLTLELYSCNSKEATVEQALYFPLPKIDKDFGIEIPERCYVPTVYQTASLVLATLGEGDLSGVMNELSKQLLV